MSLRNPPDEYHRQKFEEWLVSIDKKKRLKEEEKKKKKDKASEVSMGATSSKDERFDSIDPSLGSRQNISKVLAPQPLAVPTESVKASDSRGASQSSRLKSPDYSVSHAIGESTRVPGLTISKPGVGSLSSNSATSPKKVTFVVTPSTESQEDEQPRPQVPKTQRAGTSGTSKDSGSADTTNKKAKSRVSTKVLQIDSVNIAPKRKRASTTAVASDITHNGGPSTNTKDGDESDELGGVKLPTRYRTAAETRVALSRRRAERAEEKAREQEERAAFEEEHPDLEIRQSLRPVSQPFPKIAVQSDVRWKKLVDIAKSEEGAVDRTFDPKITSPQHRYERVINRTTGRNLTKIPHRRTTDQRLRVTPKGPRSPPRPVGPSLDDIRRCAPKTPAHIQGDRGRLSSSLFSCDTASGQDSEGLTEETSARPQKRAKQDTLEEHLQNYLEIADQDPYAKHVGARTPRTY